MPAYEDVHIQIILFDTWGNMTKEGSRPVMGKLFKEGAKGKEKNFRRANIIY